MKTRLLTIEFLESLHHGSGFGLSGLVDRSILRDSLGVPFLAGSALKGRLRHAVLRLLLAEGKPACQTGDRKELCRGAERCAICLMFGSPAFRGTLLVSDAYPVGALKQFFEKLRREAAGPVPLESSIRSCTSMNRARGVVTKGHLFSTETLPAGLRFESAVRGDLLPDYEALLKDASTVLTHFGAGASHGLGRCDYRWSDA